MPVPLDARKTRERLGRDITFQMAIGSDRESLAMITIDVVLHPATEVDGGGHDDRFRIHEAADRLPLQCLSHHHLLVTAPGGAVQEHADEAGPNATDRIAIKELQDPPTDQEPSEELA